MRRKFESSLAEKRALVTGAGGFIGRPLVSRLRQEGVRVSAVDKAQGFDVCVWANFERLLKRKWDLVYHLAGVMHVPYSWKCPHETFTTNLLGTLNVLEFCRLTEAAHLVFVSSAMYGSPKYLPIDETHPISPTNPYSWSKYSAEELCRGYSKLYGLNVTILRPFNIYGPGQRTDFVVASVVEQARSNKCIEVNDLAPKRDYLYVDDMVEAFVAAGRRKQIGIEVFNIGSGTSHSVGDVVNTACEQADDPLKVVVTGESRKGEVLDVVADIRAARRALKWKPTVDLKDGIAKMMQ